MKKELKGFILGVLLMAMIFSMPITGFGTTGSKTLSVYYNNIKVFINQSMIDLRDASGNTVEPFIYNGTTYLPLRAVANALGQEVSWDNKTKSVYIGSQPPQNEIPFSRKNPAPIGALQTISVKSLIGNHNASVSINSIERGTTAWAKIKQANMFNDEAPEGYEYILANITITANSVDNDGAVSVSEYDFTSYSSNDEEYQRYAIVNPEPSLSGKIFTGGSQSGFATFVVKVDDPAPKVVYGDSYDGSGGIWFKLY